MTALPQHAATASAAAQAPAAAPGITAEQHAQLAAAKLAHAPIRRAVRVATFSAVTLAVFAVLSLPFAVFGWRAAFVAACLAACTVFEFRGRNALRRLDPAGPRVLTFNQIGLTAGLTVYCLWSAHAAWFGPDLYAEAVARNPEIADLLEPYRDLFRQLTVAFYGVVLVVGLAFQAAVIAYYHTRRHSLRRLLDDTPAWARDLVAR
ncbi:MAG: hypothetical protein AAFX76_07830 [Planctomycetota bacterium]